MIDEREYGQLQSTVAQMKENQAHIQDQLSDILAALQAVNIQLATAKGGARVAIGIALVVGGIIGAAMDLLKGFGR